MCLVNGFRSERMLSAAGHGRARVAWDAYARAVTLVMSLIQKTSIGDGIFSDSTSATRCAPLSLAPVDQLRRDSSFLLLRRTDRREPGSVFVCSASLGASASGEALAAGCGLRQGEAIGIRVPDLDLESDTLHPRQQIRLEGGRPVLALPRCQRVRTVLVGEWALGDARRHLLERSPLAESSLQSS